MIKVCFYSQLYPQTAADIKGYGFELVDTSASDTAYWEAIRDRWGKDNLLIIEQDMQFLPECLFSFEMCREQWCLYDYDILMMDGVTVAPCETGIGLCRIRKELQESISFESSIPVHWGWTDLWLNTIADVNGLSRHTHGTVKHYHNYHSEAPDVPGWEVSAERTAHSDDKVYTDNVFHTTPPPWNGFSAAT